MGTTLRERDVQHLILDYLWTKGIFAFRLGTGQFFGSHKGKTWTFIAHSLGPGASDILALPHPRPPVWIEVKLPGARQRPSQKQFQIWVEEWGFPYIVARSIEDLKAVDL